MIDSAWARGSKARLSCCSEWRQLAEAQGSRTLKIRPFLSRRRPPPPQRSPIDSKRLTSEGYERQRKKAATGFEPMTYRLPLRLSNHVGKGFHSGNSGINIATVPGRRQFLTINTPEARKVDLPRRPLCHRRSPETILSQEEWSRWIR